MMVKITRKYMGIVIKLFVSKYLRWKPLLEKCGSRGRGWGVEYEPGTSLTNLACERTATAGSWVRGLAAQWVSKP
jgi:hypothetical protein